MPPPPRLAPVGHPAGTDDEQVTLLTSDLRAAQAARRFLRANLGGVADDTLQTAMLLISELVSNAVKHGAGPVRLSVVRTRGGAPVRVRVGVVDDDPSPPRLVRPGPVAGDGVSAAAGDAVSVPAEAVSIAAEGGAVASDAGAVASDAGPGGPRDVTDSFLPESGRGVLLLDALATRWGVEAEPPGKQVWFELDLPG